MVQGRIVNRAELAKICGVSLPTIEHWRSQGCPVVRSPAQERIASTQAQQCLFDTADVITWLLNQARRSWQ